MQSFIDFLTGLVILLATAALAQIGIDLRTNQSEPREIHRTASDDCDQERAALAAEDLQDC